jgi:hypothetical protein
MVEDIRRSREVYSKAYGTKIVMEFTGEELRSLRKSIEGLGGSWMACMHAILPYLLFLFIGVIIGYVLRKLKECETNNSCSGAHAETT